jgi:hypothetical protein
MHRLGTAATQENDHQVSGSVRGGAVQLIELCTAYFFLGGQYLWSDIIGRDRSRNG